jgi:hypothetical protein
MFLDPQNVTDGNFDGTADKGLVELPTGAKGLEVRQVSVAASAAFTVTALEARGPGYGSNNNERMPVPYTMTGNAFVSGSVCVPKGWNLVVITDGLGGGSSAQLQVCVKGLGE